jgi:hypothetical protein
LVSANPALGVFGDPGKSGLAVYERQRRHIDAGGLADAYER